MVKEIDSREGETLTSGSGKEDAIKPTPPRTNAYLSDREDPEPDYLIDDSASPPPD